MSRDPTMPTTLEQVNVTTCQCLICEYVMCVRITKKASNTHGIRVLMANKSIQEFWDKHDEKIPLL